MIDTPRTDSVDDDVLREFSEKLERELAAMTKDRNAARAENAELRARLHDALNGDEQ